MILKLLFPHINRQITEGSIVKWYKYEGELVNYGDDLLDIQIGQIQKLKREMQAKNIVTNLLRNKNIYQKTFRKRQAKGQPLKGLVRVSSSDIGFLRHIYIKESEEQKVGTVLAILTTEKNEPINLPESNLNQAASFRVAINFIIE